MDKIKDLLTFLGSMVYNTVNFTHKGYDEKK